jgi:hypothetical protein
LSDLAKAPWPIKGLKLMPYIGKTQGFARGPEPNGYSHIFARQRKSTINAIAVHHWFSGLESKEIIKARP